MFMTGSKFVYIWRYMIRPGRKADFLAAYHSEGDWAELFSRDSNYLKTELLQDVSDENVFITIDYWTSESARNSFRESFADEFGELDKKCEAFTVSEVLIGDFVVQGGDAT